MHRWSSDLSMRRFSGCLIVMLREFISVLEKSEVDFGYQ